MKIIINATNLIEDRPLREVDRLITMGKAHLPETPELILTTFVEHVDDMPSKEPQITYEDLDEIIFREPSIDIDPIEPIPTDKYVSFDEPKKAKKKQFWNK